MNEDRLKAALTSELEHVRATTALRQRIDERVRPRRVWVRRTVLALGAAVLALVAVLAYMTFAGRQSVRQMIGEPEGAEYFAGFWPESTREGAARAQREVDEGKGVWRRDPVEVARGYAKILDWREVSIGEASAEFTGEAAAHPTARVVVRPLVGESGSTQAGPEHEFRFVGLPGAGRPAWFLSEIRGSNIVLDAPASGSIVTSPIQVSGRGRTFEGSLQATVVDDTGRVFGRERLTAGGSEMTPFGGKVPFEPPSTPEGLLRIEGSAGLGGPSPDITIVRIRFADQSPGEAVSNPPAAADEALRCFLEARIRRDLGAAKPCMTDRLASSYTDPLEFTGPSSPNIKRFTILGNGDAAFSDRFEVAVRSYEGTAPDGLLYYTDDLIVVIKLNGEWRVDRWTRGSETPIGRKTNVALHFLELGDTPTCGPDGPEPKSFVTREREIPVEPTTEATALSVARELVTGPWPNEGDAANPFPPGSRVTSVKLVDGVAEVKLSDGALATDDRCNFARAALERTLLGLPGIREVRAS